MTLRPAITAMLFALVALTGCRGERRAVPAAVRLGYFPNLTHAPAIAGVRLGFFAAELGAGVTLEPKLFNAGPEAVEALFSEALDIAYLGPNPAINAFVQSNGEAIRIIAGATSGGAALVVRPGITSAAQLRGKKLATPQLGNTQDVALRSWLATQGLATTLEGGGDVSIVSQPNAQTLETFRAGQIDGAWLPEPWASRLVLEGGGSVLVDERTLWPEGRFVTTHVVVRTRFLREHPDLVERFLRGHLRALDYLNGDAAAARHAVNQGIEALTGRALPAAVIERAWSNLVFTADPLAASLQVNARAAEAQGLLRRPALEGIYDLEPLNRVLAAAGRPAVRQ